LHRRRIRNDRVQAHLQIHADFIGRKALGAGIEAAIEAYADALVADVAGAGAYWNALAGLD